MNNWCSPTKQYYNLHIQVTEPVCRAINNVLLNLELKGESLSLVDIGLNLVWNFQNKFKSSILFFLIIMLTRLKVNLNN